MPKGFRIEQAFTELAVKILFEDSSGFDEMRCIIILLREAEIIDIVYDLDMDKLRRFTLDRKICLNVKLFYKSL